MLFFLALFKAFLGGGWELFLSLFLNVSFCKITNQSMITAKSKITVSKIVT